MPIKPRLKLYLITAAAATMTVAAGCSSSAGGSKHAAKSAVVNYGVDAAPGKPMPSSTTPPFPVGVVNADLRKDLSQVKVPSDAQIDDLVTKDTAANGANDGVIYVDLHHLATKQVGTQDLDIQRFALVKILNSVSLNPKIVTLTPLDDAETLYRVRLADYTLAGSWATIMTEKHAASNVRQIGDKKIVQGDWLVYTLSRPEIYGVIMRSPASVIGLEAALQPDYSKAIYVNSSKSTVAFYGRVLMRIPLEIGGKPGGYYWRSFDFDGVPEQTAGFAAPQALRYATLPTFVAGEYFFSLPNGLQAYMLSGFAFQTRLDAQLFVATDFRRPEDGLTTCAGDNVKGCGYVLNGESCMTCHGQGINAPTVLADVTGGGATKATIQSVIGNDQKRFADALAEMGYGDIKDEPIQVALATFKKRTQLDDHRVQGGEFEAVNATGPMLQR